MKERCSLHAYLADRTHPSIARLPLHHRKTPHSFSYPDSSGQSASSIQAPHRPTLRFRPPIKSSLSSCLFLLLSGCGPDSGVIRMCRDIAKECKGRPSHCSAAVKFTTQLQPGTTKVFSIYRKSEPTVDPAYDEINRADVNYRRTQPGCIILSHFSSSKQVRMTSGILSKQLRSGPPKATKNTKKDHVTRKATADGKRSGKKNTGAPVTDSSRAAPRAILGV